MLDKPPNKALQTASSGLKRMLATWGILRFVRCGIRSGVLGFHLPGPTATTKFQSRPVSLYTIEMRVRTVRARLLEGLILAGLAGAVALGLAAWLTPAGISPIWAAVIVSSAGALAILIPPVIRPPQARNGVNSTSTPNTYYDYGSSVDKDEGWGD